MLTDKPDIDYKTILDWAVSFAKKNGANDCKISLGKGKGLSISYRDNKIESFERAKSSQLSLTLYMDNKFSTNSTNILEKKELEKFILECIESTKFLAPDSYRSITDSSLYPKRNDLNSSNWCENEFKLCDMEYEKIFTKEKINLLIDTHNNSTKDKTNLISATSSYFDSFSESFIVFSNGFEAYKKTSYFSLSAQVSVHDTNGTRPEGYDFVSSRFFNGINKSEKVGTEAFRKASEQLGQQKIETGNYTLISENSLSASLLFLLISPLDGAYIQQKSSWLEGLKGEQIANSILTIVDNPFVISGYGTSLFDSDGIELKKRTIIENGILVDYLIDFYYSKKLGMKPNSNSLTNLSLANGNRNCNQIISTTDKGILVNNILGGNYNPVSGDFSFGISGFLIKNGKKDTPVNEMNISGNAKNFFKNLVEVGNDNYEFSSFQTPTLVFENIVFSGS